MKLHERMKSIALSGTMDSEEIEILSYIQNHAPELGNLFRSNLEQGRRGIMHRLLQAILRENIGSLAEEMVIRENGHVEIRLADDSQLSFQVKEWYSLGRFELSEAPILLSRLGIVSTLNHPVQLLDLLEIRLELQNDEEKARFQRFRQEIQNSTANLSLALTAFDWRSNKLKENVKEEGWRSSLDWVHEQKRQDEQFSPLSFYEQWVIEGHPLHPGAKIKMGLDVGEVMQYSPEWGAQPEVAVIAVSKDVCSYTPVSEGLSPSKILYQEYPELEEHVSNTLQQMGLQSQDYELIPVHPWQFDHTLPTLYQEAIKRHELVPIPNFRICTSALMSFRSLAPLQRRGEGKHHIKTAVNIQMTGAVRTVSPASTVNGPLLSKIFREVQRTENRFNGRFIILEERVGIHYCPIDEHLSEDERNLYGKNLAAIFRENPENYVYDGEISMPGSALIARSPISDQPIVAELIEELATVEQIEHIETACTTFLERYAATALPGFLTMMCRYGVSLEGHLQNSVAVFKNGTLVRMILRDFGGVRILRERMARQGMMEEFYSGSVIIIDDLVDLRNKLYYPVFQNHFGELISCIARWSGIEEIKLWTKVLEVSQDVFAQLKEDPMISEQAADDERSLFEPTLDLKAMAMMRLKGTVTSYCFSKVPNPLFEAMEGM